MKQVTITLPDSVELSAQEIQALVLEKIAAGTSSAPELSTSLSRSLSPEEESDIRHLIGLYYAERTADLLDAHWQQNGWTADTMYQWLREHLRTTHGHPTA